MPKNIFDSKSHWVIKLPSYQNNVKKHSTFGRNDDNNKMVPWEQKSSEKVKAVKKGHFELEKWRNRTCKNILLFSIHFPKKTKDDKHVQERLKKVTSILGQVRSLA